MLSAGILLFSERLSKKKIQKVRAVLEFISSGGGETDDELARVTSNSDEW